MWTCEVAKCWLKDLKWWNHIGCSNLRDQNFFVLIWLNETCKARKQVSSKSMVMSDSQRNQFCLVGQQNMIRSCLPLFPLEVHLSFSHYFEEQWLEKSHLDNLLAKVKMKDEEHSYLAISVTIHHKSILNFLSKKGKDGNSKAKPSLHFSSHQW